MKMVQDEARQLPPLPAPIDRIVLITMSRSLFRVGEVHCEPLRIMDTPDMSWCISDVHLSGLDGPHFPWPCMEKVESVTFGPTLLASVRNSPLTLSCCNYESGVIRT